MKTKHAMTVDVEEYFQVEALANIVDRREWPYLESRVVASTERCLRTFEREGIKATFFTLGQVARRHPQLIRRIVGAGHELACHGDAHQRITSQSQAEFRDDIRRAKATLEDAGGVRVIGYRAPTFSVVNETRWALDVLREEGFLYDSSIYPIHHDRYGIPDAPRTPYRIDAGIGAGMVELPPTTMRVAGRNVPCGGGGYLRLLPLTFNLWAMKRAAEDGPVVVYLHPWEIDANQPRFALPKLASVRSYAGLATMEAKLVSVIRSFSFGTAMDVLHARGLLSDEAIDVTNRRRETASAEAAE